MAKNVIRRLEPRAVLGAAAALGTGCRRRRGALPWPHPKRRLSAAAPGPRPRPRRGCARLEELAVRVPRCRNSAGARRLATRRGACRGYSRSLACRNRSWCVSVLERRPRLTRGPYRRLALLVAPRRPWRARCRGRRADCTAGGGGRSRSRTPLGRCCHGRRRRAAKRGAPRRRCLWLPLGMRRGGRGSSPRQCSSLAWQSR